MCFFFQAEDGIRDYDVTGVQTCALPIYEYLDFVEFHSPIGKILGVSISGATIPTGVGVLTTVSFIEFGEDSICFVDDDACANSTEVCEDCTCENNVPVVHIIAGSNANEIPSTWGDCFVNDDN